MPSKKEEPKKAAPAKKEEPKKVAVKPAAKEEKKAPPIKYTVKFDKEKEDWVILKTDSDRAIRRTKTKEEALKVAKTLAENQDANLVVHKKDGKFQKQ